MNDSSSPPILVVGAGIAGMTAALEAAEAGSNVVLVERDPSVGGRVMRIHHYFPKHCPPSCGMEINIRRVEQNPRIRTIAGAEVVKADKSGSGYSVTLKVAALHVNDRCTLCDDCAKVCPAKVKDPFDLEMSEKTAIRAPHAYAYPRRYTLDRDACPDGCDKCKAACGYDAIDLDAKATEETIEVSSVVLATGWKPYAIENLTELGGGTIKDVIANVNMERMANANGPTGGKILKPSSGEPPKKVAFVQCAGSRDTAHLPYCSAVCCLASLKQAVYVREQLPESEVTIFYIDRRAPGRNEDVLTKVAAMDGVKLVRGKVGQITEGDSGQLELRVEDTEANKILTAEADMVVLATGMVSNLKDANLPFDVKLDDDGFGLDDLDAGIVIAGVARRPEDVASSNRDATGAAAKAVVAAGRRA